MICCVYLEKLMNISISPDQTSTYLDHLPAIFQQTDDGQDASFIGRFLLAFEAILTGLSDHQNPGLEELIDRMPTVFSPRPSGGGRTYRPWERAPDDFLPWLAGWVGLGLREDWVEEEKRRFISRVVPLYRLRGTRAGIREMLALFVGGQNIRVLEDETRPHYFKVTLFLKILDPDLLERKEQMARTIVDREKPAHTYYDLHIEVPTMRIGMYSSVGIDTMLGSPEDPA